MGKKFEDKMILILEKGASEKLIEEINKAKQKILEIIYYIRVISLGFKAKSDELKNSLVKTIRLIKDYQGNKLETKRFIESCEEILKDLTKDYNFLWENQSRIINGVNNIIEKGNNTKNLRYCQFLRNSFDKVYYKNLGFTILKNCVDESDQSIETLSNAVDNLPKIINECIPGIKMEDIEMLVGDGIPIMNLSKEKYLKIKESEFGSTLFIRFK